MPRLVLIRHAKSSWTTGLDDLERPLSKRGRRDAAAVGALLRDRAITPDLLWCSTAVRARQTWDGAHAAGARARWVEHRHELYGADGEEVARLIATVHHGVDTVTVIGHHDGVPGCLALLARREPADAQTWSNIDRKFPTSAVAVLEIPAWRDLVPGSARLIWYQVPRG